MGVLYALSILHVTTVQNTESTGSELTDHRKTLNSFRPFRCLFHRVKINKIRIKSYGILDWHEWVQLDGDYQCTYFECYRCHSGRETPYVMNLADSSSLEARHLFPLNTRQSHENFFFPHGTLLVHVANTPARCELNWI